MDKTANLLEVLKDKAQYMDRRIDKGFVNDSTGSSLGIRNNGDIVAASSETLQYKMQNSTGTATEISLQSNTITNRKIINSDEIIVNKHKLNPQLYELTGMKQLFGKETQAVGGLTMLGTVLVKAWEPNLQKWVLIRRQVRIPVFSQLLNTADAPEELGLNTSISEELSNMKKEE